VRVVLAAVALLVAVVVPVVVPRVDPVAVILVMHPVR
jgi:hypothetical protein